MLKDSGWAGAAHATWTSDSVKGPGWRRVTHIDTPVQDGRDSVIGMEPGPCMLLSSRRAGTAQAD